MPAPEVRLEQIDATELADALTFISQWLTGPDQGQLAASFGRFVGTDTYDLTALSRRPRSLHLPARPRRRRATLRPRRAVTRVGPTTSVTLGPRRVDIATAGFPTWRAQLVSRTSLIPVPRWCTPGSRPHHRSGVSMDHQCPSPSSPGAMGGGISALAV
jgi:hypothetical protein